MAASHRLHRLDLDHAEVMALLRAADTKFAEYQQAIEDAVSEREAQLLWEECAPLRSAMTMLGAIRG